MESSSTIDQNQPQTEKPSPSQKPRSRNPKTNQKTTSNTPKNPNSPKPQRPNKLDAQPKTEQQQKAQIEKNTSNAPQDIKILISNIHTLAGEEELAKVFEGKPIKKVYIHFYGPKSTGTGWVIVDGNGETALEIIKQLQGFLLREKPLELSLKNKSREVRKVKNEKKKVPKKNILSYQQELDEVQKKFSQTFKYISQEAPVSFSLSMKPSDPDFPFDMDFLSLNFEIPDEYPQNPAKITVLNEDLPQNLKDQISEASLQREKIAYKNKPMLLGILKWIDNNLEKLLVDRKATIQYNAAQQGIQLITPESLKQNLKIEGPQGKEEEELGSNEDEDQEDDEEDEYEDEEEEEEAKEGSQNNFATTTAHRGTQIKAENLKLLGVGLLECTEFIFIIACTRCKSQSPVTIPNGQTFAQECDKCKTAHVVTFRKEAMHEASQVLGYLDIEGCAPFDIAESNFVASCFECSNAVPFKKLNVNGTEISQNCHSCHKKISVSIERIKFNRIRASRPAIKDASIVVPAKKKQRDPGMIGVKVGTPLPDEGTCKHYKKSKRWLRFPCCKRVFPCDTCHDEKNPDGHEIMWANRMLCGQCSREQPIADGCKFCNAGLTQSSKHFWEGGKGMRNQKFLSSKDSHKHSGLNKTQSMKSTRVGPKKHRDNPEK